MSSELIGLLIGLILTLFIYSYLIGDNPLYQVAVHLLVGVSAAYAAVVAVQRIILPIFDQDISIQTGLTWVIPLIFVFLLLLKRLPSLAWLGNNTLALLIGVGAATALLGALTGTLWPQVTAVTTSTAPRWQNLLIAIFTVAVLVTFQFTGRAGKDGQWRRPIWQRGVAQIGQAVLMITFGVLFAALFNTALILLSGRLGYFLNQFLN